MSHKRLAELIQARQVEMETDEEHAIAHETILSIFTALDQGDVTEGRALHLLRYQATRLADEPTHAALYRQAAAAIRHMQREER